MRSDAIETFDPAMMRTVKIARGRLMNAVAKDFSVRGRPEDDAIIFTFSLLRSGVVAHSNDRDVFSEGTHTFTAIWEACGQAIQQNTYSPGRIAITASDLARYICRLIISREGFMANVVNESLRQAFGPFCHMHASEFWTHLGFEMSSEQMPQL